jgi:hypothetical protein
VRIDRVTIGRAAAMRDPCAGTGAHHRFERGHQAAGGALHLDLIAMPLMDVGLPIGNHDDVLAA